MLNRDGSRRAVKGASGPGILRRRGLGFKNGRRCMAAKQTCNCAVRASWACWTGLARPGSSAAPKRSAQRLKDQGKSICADRHVNSHRALPDLRRRRCNELHRRSIGAVRPNTLALEAAAERRKALSPLISRPKRRLRLWATSGVAGIPRKLGAPQHVRV